MAMIRQRIQSLIDYEKKRSFLFNWIINQCPYKKEGISILDFSGDGGIFTGLLVAEIRKKCEVPVNRVLITIRDKNGIQTDAAPGFEFVRFSFDESSRQNFQNSFSSLGKYDLIIVNEILCEVQDYVSAFYEALRTHCLMDEGSRILTMARAKEYPPIPIPSNGSLQWREMTVSEQNFQRQMLEADLWIETFVASSEIRVSKEAWRNVLKSGCIDVVKFARGCDEFAIDSFINAKNGKMFVFEEKILVILAREFRSDDKRPPKKEERGEPTSFIIWNSARDNDF